MRELSSIRLDYVVQRGDHDERCRDAHRVIRNAMAIAQVFRNLLAGDLSDALTAIERAETPDEDGPAVLTPHDAAALAAVLEEVHRLLKASLDREWRPQGPAANHILDEAALPFADPDGKQDIDRVFEITKDGSVGLRYPRISLAELHERLPEVAAFLRSAGEHGKDVVVDD
jgi:hypothetical protein